MSKQKDFESTNEVTNMKEKKMDKNKMQKVVTCSRTTNKEQMKEDFSFEAQRETLREYAEKNKQKKVIAEVEGE